MAVKQETLIIPERKIMQIPQGVKVGKNWGRADLHYHVRDVGGDIEKAFETAREKGIIIAITEHDNIENFPAAWSLAQKLGMENQVLLGAEVTLLVQGDLPFPTLAHFLIYFPDPNNVPSKKVYDSCFGWGKDAKKAMQVLHQMEGFGVLAHPTSPLTFSAGRRSIQRNLEDPDITKPDGLEVLNATFAGQTALPNARTLFETGKFSAFGGSDGRDPEQLGYCQTRFPGRTKEDLIKAVRNRETVAQGSFYTLDQMAPVAGKQIVTMGVRAAEIVNSLFGGGK